jgi:hypothetical protein
VTEQGKQAGKQAIEGIKSQLGSVKSLIGQ